MKEYRVLYTEKMGSVDSDISNSAFLMEKELNNYATQGWRLVSVTRTMANGSTYDFHLFLERDKAD